MSRRRLAVALVLTGALVTAAAACGGGSNDAGRRNRGSTTSASGTATDVAGSASDPFTSYVATARVPSVSVYGSPDATEPRLQLENPWRVDPANPAATVPQVFLVQDRSVPGWVQVLLPVRPNGSTGWIRSSDVTIAPTTHRIRVELGARRITVTNAGTVTYRGPVAVGAADTPTPTGKYSLRVLLQAPDPDTAYGPFAYGLSSHSDALDTFNGGDAEIGIHGNDDASVLGTDITHGCVRMDNAAITELAAQLPLGTPVDIVA
ncbi:MAG: L,D-transpeptidase [Acidimicrobiia bacterium]